MKREDLNKYNTNNIRIPTERTDGETSRAAGATAKTLFGMTWKAVKTVLFVALFSAIAVGISMAIYVLSFRDVEPPNIGSMNLDYTSFVYVQDASGNWVEYMPLKGVENRVWVEYVDIPQTMIDAMVAIEDKRFFEHDGVDWIRTAGAVVNLGSDGGGSTLTQQLIKNLTGRNEVSFTRKIEEIFMALNLEKAYSKEEILTAYLNVVNFGSGTRGVQAAANLYFGKDIMDCNIAQCAAIAGITQNPYQFDPLIYPENNQRKQKMVIEEMLAQEKITQQEYNDAMAEADNMQFVGYENNAALEDANPENDEDTDIWNWYIETLFEDLIDDIMAVENLSRDLAILQIYRGGYEIYSAMNPTLQEEVEQLFKNEEILPADPNVNFGTYIIDYTGKTLAVVGNRYAKTGNRVWNNAVDTTRQTGSSIKPISIYAPAFEEDFITYGTVLEDEPIQNFFRDTGKPGPYNFSRTYEGTMNVPKAIAMSQNAPAAHIVNDMGPEVSYNFLAQNLHFENLDPSRDMGLSPMALGGLTNGATMREMAAAFQIFGNGGVYNKPYTYLYVKNHDGSTIVDNRDKAGEQAMNADNAAVMNKLLHGVIYDPNVGTGRMVQIDGVDIFGKTGTTDEMADIWFIGGTHDCVASIWNGYTEGLVTLEDTDTAKVMWRALMVYLTENSERFGLSANSGYYVSENIVQRSYCSDSGLMPGEKCVHIESGWYNPNNIPRTCNGGSDHIAKGSSTSPSPSPSTSPSASPSPSPSPSPSVTPSESPSPSPPTSSVESPGSMPDPPSEIDPPSGPEPPPSPPPTSSDVETPPPASSDVGETPPP